MRDNFPMSPHQPLPLHLRNRAFTVHDSDAAGVGRGRLRGNDLVPVFRGVRIPTDVDLTHESVRAAYMTRMAPGQAFSHLTAARIWGIPLPHEFSVAEGVHVSVRDPAPRREGPASPGTWSPPGITWC
jgi:hypothetical protein